MDKKTMLLAVFLISPAAVGTTAMQGVSVVPSGKAIISCVQETKGNPMLLARMQGDAFLLQERDGIKLRHEERQKTSMNTDLQVKESYDSVTHLSTEGAIQTRQVNQWKTEGLICLELQIISQR